MRFERKKVSAVAGWILFTGSSAYVLYKLLNGLLLSLQYRSSFYLSSMSTTKWVISALLFFTGIFLIYKSMEKS